MFLSSVTQYLGLSIVFTCDVEYLALVSSVGCVGALVVSGVSKRARLPSFLLRLPEAACEARCNLPIVDRCPRNNHEMRRLVDHSGSENLWVLRAFDWWEPHAGTVKDSSVAVRLSVLMLNLYLSVSQWDNNTNANRDAHTVQHTREILLNERI